MKLLLLLVALCNLKNVSGILGQNKETHNRSKLIQNSQLSNAYEKDKSNSGLNNQNFHVLTKRGTDNVTTTTSSSIINADINIQPDSQTSINFKSDTLPKCPSMFTYYTDVSGESVCYLITEPTPFPPPCPYPTTMEYFFISWQIQVTYQDHWAFTHRNVSDIGKKNCLLRRTGQVDLIPTTCSNKYPGVCIYNGNFTNGAVAIPTFSDYCRKRYNDSCVSDDFSSVPSCYCKSQTPSKQQPRDTFCKHLVEIKEAYLNNVLLTLLSGNESCWIGLERKEDFSNYSTPFLPYKWSYTNTKGDYAFWSDNLAAFKSYGALGRDGWVLEEDGALNCAICKMEVEDHAQVYMHITYNKATHFVEVRIENPIEVFQNVTCFSPDSEDYRIIDLRSSKESLVVRQLEFPFMSSGYYWCEGLQIANPTPVHSNTIFIPRSFGHEYALITTSPEDADEAAAYLPKSPSTVACNSIRKQFHDYVSSARPIKTIIYNAEDGTIEVLCHITTKLNQLSIADDFKMVSNLFTNSSAKITNFYSIDACLPEVTTSGDRTLQWPETRIGVTTVPEQLCLQEDGSPVTRTCAGDFYYGGHWLGVNGTCAELAYSDRTLLLEELLKSDTTTSSNLSMTLLNITEEPENVTSFEIYLISKSLEKLAEAEESVSVPDITMTVNNIMHFDRSELRDSQKTLNSTDTVLYSLDEMLAQTELDNSGYMFEVTEKLVVQISDLTKTKVNGIKLGKTRNGFKSNKVEALHRGISQEDLIEENLELALLIPPQLHDDIIHCVGPDLSPNLITAVFYDDVLFNEQQNMPKRPDGRIISVSIPNFDCPFTVPLQIVFNSVGDVTKLKCASWNYGFNSFMESTHGRWTIEDDPKTFRNTTYQICEFRHVTHFTLLLLGDFDDDKISLREEKLLDVTTAVGSGISILSLIMIFLTAIMFRRFNSPGTAILLNFSIAITAKIVLLFIADNLAGNGVLCTISGAALHYVVLAQFCWMLTIATFQYKRYVIVFENTTSNLVAKACAFAWGLPLIPVIIIVSISRNNYGRNSHGLCYALGNYFIFGVLAPVAVMLLINLIIFILIIIGIKSPRPDRVHQKRDDTYSLQVKLAILLFFMLGLTWGFGLLASLDGGSIIFSFLFCVTATLQGFVLFLYFIVLNEKTRKYWTKSKYCCCKFEKKENNRDSAARALKENPRNPQHSDIDGNRKPTKLLRWQENEDDGSFLQDRL